ncbi:45 kda calcium-binding [Lasius niger]|uniref:45 kDa calcium-binding n=1 Tax=Lasius niger TaxID=67767 RepID=A0A0J7NP58_LASNI|nr:45 kda calcium-binding [Lasius niger]
MTCKQELTCLRFLRWTVLVPLVIYISLLFVKYNKSVPLKSLSTPPSDKDREGSVMDSLFLELQTATVDKMSLAGYKDAGIDRGDVEGVVREVVEAENRENPRNLLEDIFRRADTDENQLLDIQELAKWIHTKITEHITRAMRENVGLFTAIDTNLRDGIGN